MMKTAIRKTILAQMPKAGDKVVPIGKGGMPGYPNGTVGVVVEILDGCCGPIVAVRFAGYGIVDLFWRKVRRA